MKKICIYHGNCADGFTAAWVLWKKFGNEFEYHAGVYQNDPPDVKGKDVVFVDFSYKREVIKKMRESANSILILDHHKTAMEDLKRDGGNFGIDISQWEGGLNWERHETNITQDLCEGIHDSVYCLFDMERSGAGIAWDFFNSGIERPQFINHVEDRDLWKFNLPFTREIQASIFSYEYSFENWEMFSQMDISELVTEGKAIERKHFKDVNELVKVVTRKFEIRAPWLDGPTPSDLGFVEAPIANLPYTLTSDAGHLLCEGFPFAGCYWDTPEGRIFSLRSREDGADVGEIAKEYGGGGHKHASGFRVPFDHELAK